MAAIRTYWSSAPVWNVIKSTDPNSLPTKETRVAFSREALVDLGDISPARHWSIKPVTSDASMKAHSRQGMRIVSQGAVAVRY